MKFVLSLVLMLFKLQVIKFIAKMNFGIYVQVVQLLSGEEVPTDLKQKTFSGRAVLLDGCDLQDYTCTSYLNDLNRHMELVME